MEEQLRVLGCGAESIECFVEVLILDEIIEDSQLRMWRGRGAVHPVSKTFWHVLLEYVTNDLLLTDEWRNFHPGVTIVVVDNKLTASLFGVTLYCLVVPDLEYLVLVQHRDGRLDNRTEKLLE